VAVEVRGLLADDARRTEMAEAARRRGRPHASREIASKLLTLIG